MKIIIIGAGKVGQTIAQYLCEEDHSVIVIDKQEQVLEHLVNEYDLQAVCGDGAICSVLTEAEVEKAYLVIATTASDEINILSCMTARKMGARHCIARVRNPNYSEQLVFMRNELGLSMIVNPEFQAALEISRILRFPSAIKMESFAKDRIDLVEIRIGKDSKLLDVPLWRIPRLFDVQVLVCAVERGNRVFIPSGDFVLKEDDRIHITASHGDLYTFFKNMGILQGEVKTVMLIGGGRIAYYLARQLSEMGMKVKIIEQDEQRCVELAERLPKTTIIYGDGTQQEVLLEEGIESVDALVSLTGIDEENMILSLYASTKNVHKIVTKINRPALIDLLQSFGSDSIVSPKATTANTILQYVRAKQNLKGNSIKTLHRLVNGQVDALEFFINTPSEGLGIPFKKLPIRDDVLIACILRGNRTIIPNGNDCLQLNDGVLIVTTNRHIVDLRDILVLGEEQ